MPRGAGESFLLSSGQRTSRPSDDKAARANTPSKEEIAAKQAERAAKKLADIKQNLAKAEDELKAFKARKSSLLQQMRVKDPEKAVQAKLAYEILTQQILPTQQAEVESWEDKLLPYEVAEQREKLKQRKLNEFVVLRTVARWGMQERSERKFNEKVAKLREKLPKSSARFKKEVETLRYRLIELPMKQLDGQAIEYSYGSQTLRTANERISAALAKYVKAR
jgi:hypothetical protein